ncbi:hypothetical protein BDZ91DRAFT_729472 [Kalaharituber pfeilii]|nr:hypothetical protein BDZ91DRAFT_729472 [Kalaharituber pfeilii]
MSTTFHPSYLPTHIQTSKPLPPSSAAPILQSFIHWTSVTRPIRNRKYPYQNVPVVPFPQSVLNNLRRIEMGLRGEQAPRVKPSASAGASADAQGEKKRKRKRFEEEEEEREGGKEEVAAGEDAEMREEVEIQAGGREMRTDGKVVDETPTVLTAGSNKVDKEDKKSKEKRKSEKKARKKEEKKLRAEKRKKEKEERGHVDQEDEYEEGEDDEQD